MSVRGWVMSFYIPQMPSKKLSILRDIKLLKELEVSKDDIMAEIKKNKHLSYYLKFMQKKQI